MKHFKQFARITVPFSDPGEIDMDDATEVYGEIDFDFPDTPCEASPVGQCEYTIHDPDHCMHCGRKT